VTEDLNDTGTCDDHDRPPDRHSDRPSDRRSARHTDEALAERMP
jgi:hypothetical protein